MLSIYNNLLFCSTFMHCMHHVIKHISFDHIFLFVSGKYKQKFTTQGRKEGSTDQPTERPTYIIINFKFYCICTLFKTNSDVIILSRVFQRVLGQCQEGWLFWIAETTSKDGQEGWLNINIVNKEFPETLLTVSQIVFV